MDPFGDRSKRATVKPALVFYMPYPSILYKKSLISCIIKYFLVILHRKIGIQPSK